MISHVWAEAGTAPDATGALAESVIENCAPGAPETRTVTLVKSKPGDTTTLAAAQGSVSAAAASDTSKECAANAATAPHSVTANIAVFFTWLTSHSVVGESIDNDHCARFAVGAAADIESAVARYANAA